MTHEEIVEIATKVATETAVEVLRKECIKANERKIENAKKNTKKVLKNLKMLQAHFNNAAVSVEKDYKGPLKLLLAELFDHKGFVKVQSIVSSKERTEIMINHIENMLSVYRHICESENKPNYDILVGFYIERVDMEELAKVHNISLTTAWRCLDKAVSDLSVMLWGVYAFV